MESANGIGAAVRAGFDRAAEIAYLGDWVGKYCFIFHGSGINLRL